MPNIHFELEDNQLCEGCPMDNKSRNHCMSKFNRTFMKAEETEVNPSRDVMHAYFMMDESPKKDIALKVSWVRPQVCTLVTEFTKAPKGFKEGMMILEKKHAKRKRNNTEAN